MYRLLFVIAALALFSACAQGASSPEPPEIRYGEDICDGCSMIISDARFAEAYAHEVSPERYESKAFDDIGGMLLHAQKHADDAVAEWYVHDYGSEEWVDAKQATFVMSDDLHTPMGYGIIAYADATAAESTAAEVNGMVMTWDELRAAEIAHGH